MNAGLKIASKTGNAEFEDDARWQLVRQVLTSALFAKSPRMCSLLSFLMNRKLSGMEDSINEYAIGIEVFRRDARDFDTTIDPIVRVQMGRLRNRLAQYNSTCAAAGMQIVIPPGTYVPLLKPCENTQQARPISIQMAPLRKLSSCDGGGQFADGFEEELALHLFHRFGNVRARSPRYRLEASVRVEHRHARASVRLVDIQAVQIVWMHQCDREGNLAIALQEALAQAICSELHDHLSVNGTPHDEQR